MDPGMARVGQERENDMARGGKLGQNPPSLLSQGKGCSPETLSFTSPDFTEVSCSRRAYNGENSQKSTRRSDFVSIFRTLVLDP